MGFLSQFQKSLYVVLECVQHIHDRPCVRIYYPSFAVGGNASASRSPLCGMIVFLTRHQRVVSGTLNMPARHSVQESCSLQLQKLSHVLEWLGSRYCLLDIVSLGGITHGQLS